MPCLGYYLKIPLTFYGILAQFQVSNFCQKCPGHLRITNHSQKSQLVYLFRFTQFKTFNNSLFYNNRNCKQFVQSGWIQPPSVPAFTVRVINPAIYPTECRQRGVSYTGMLNVKVEWTIDKEPQVALEMPVGQVPIMVKVCFSTLLYS